MGRIRPVIIDGIAEEVSPTDTLKDVFDNKPNAKSLTGFNKQTGATEIIKVDTAKNYPLSHYSDIQTNLTDTIRG